MNLDYITCQRPDYPLIRLFNFSPDEAKRLRSTVIELAEGSIGRVDVHELPFVESLGGCRLALRRGGHDQAIIRTGEPADFQCSLASGTWEQVADLIEPFEQVRSGFQWLTGAPGEACLLMSVSGQW